GGHQAGDVGHVHPEDGAHLVGDGAHPPPVLVAGIGGEAANDHLGLGVEGDALHLVVVDDAGLGIQAVGYDVVLLAGEVGRVAVGEVAALGQIHAHHSVTGTDQGQEDGGVGL